MLVCPLWAADTPLRQIVPAAGKSLAVLQAPAARGTWVLVRDEDLTAIAPQLLSDGSLAIVEATPGKLLVRWRPGPLAKWQSLTVDLGAAPAPTPKPPDPPKPPPTPEPMVVEKLAWVVVVEESSQPPDDVDVAAIRLSGATGEIAAWAKASNVSWRMVDRDMKGPDGKQPAWFAPFANEAAGKKLPWLVGAPSGTAGPPLLSQRCPANVQGVLELLKGTRK
jgi:hypothetical protein